MNVDDTWNFLCRILKGSLNLTEVVSAVFSAPRWDAEENVGYLTVSGVLRKSTANQELLQPRFVLACFQQFFHPNLSKIDTNSASTAFHRLHTFYRRHNAMYTSHECFNECIYRIYAEVSGFALQPILTNAAYMMRLWTVVTCKQAAGTSTVARPRLSRCVQTCVAMSGHPAFT